MKIPAFSRNKAAGLLGLMLLVTLLFAGGAQAGATSPVFINEIHYDNSGTDQDEAVEVAGPAGTDLSGWSLEKYNGNGGGSYGNEAMIGVLPDQGSGFGTLFFAISGLQNGSPDGIALVKPDGAVEQFLCYEGSFTASDGPAVGLTCENIGVSESSSTPTGESLQLAGTGSAYGDFSWSGPLPATMGAINTGQSFSASPFINEIHYDNDGSDQDEAVEVAGPAGTDLTGWSLEKYNGNGGGSYGNVAMSGTLPDQDSGYGTLDFAVPGLQNGSPDGFALVAPGDVVVQFLCYEGQFTASDGPAAGMTCDNIGVSEPGSTPIGESLQLVGTGTSYSEFSWSDPQASTFGSVNNGQSFSIVVNTPVDVSCDAMWTYESQSISSAVTASDADGTVVSMSITEISPLLTTGAITLDDVEAATGVGGTASATLNADDRVAAGVYEVTITATNDDPEPQNGTCKSRVTVYPFLTIGEVQGVVEDDDSGTGHRSPYNGDSVVVQGVIYQLLQQKSGGSTYYGFHLQNTAATADGDPNSSDGIYLYQWRFNDVLAANPGDPAYLPQVGDEIIVRGRVSEYYNLTELTSARFYEVVRSGVDLDAELPAFDTDPDDELADANRYWERREGMRAQIPADSIVLNGRDVFASSADAEVWVARADSTIGQRAAAYERRSFRDAHPLDDIPGLLFDNGNGYRILMGSRGLKGAADDNMVMLGPSRTFDTMTNAPIGGVFYDYGKYQIQVEEQPLYDHGVDPAENNPLEDFDRAIEYSVVTFNVENLYDYYDDPFDGCDFHGNDGCPGVYPPFDYVPASDAVYQERLSQIAQQIIEDLHSPDIIMTQETEDQDVCTIEAGLYVCPDPADAVNNVDDKPDSLQELAAMIYSMGGPMYDAAFDRDGADDRGIISAYLFRADRVELLPASADDPVLGSNPQVYYPWSDPLPYNTDVQNPKSLNAVLPDFVGGSTDGDNVFTRPPQVALFRVWRDGLGQSVWQDLYLSDNHFSSGPDRRVEQRTEQARYNASIVDALEAANEGVYVAVGGDLNVYPRPDDPVPTPNESDQLAALYNAQMTNLWDIQVNQNPETAYSYIYQGQTQTLDQIFTGQRMMNDFSRTRVAHINADWPADYPGDGPRGTSDHDPVIGGYWLVPTADRLEALVKYFDDQGDIYGKQTLRILMARINRIRLADNLSRRGAYDAQLRAFANQVQGLAPKQMSQAAADALAQEATLMRDLR